MTSSTTLNTKQELREKLANIVVDQTEHIKYCNLFPEDQKRVDQTMQLLTDTAKAKVNKALDEAADKVRSMEIDIEASEKQIENTGITGDQLEMQILNLRIEADDRKDVLNDAVSAIERVRKEINNE